MAIYLANFVIIEGNDFAFDFVYSLKIVVGKIGIHSLRQSTDKHIQPHVAHHSAVRLPQRVLGFPELANKLV